MVNIKHKKVKRKNPVAKHGVRFNRAATHADRKKAAKRGTSKYPPPLLNEE